MTTVQAELAFSDDEHVPPVPGYEPPLNVNGAASPAPESDVAWKAPEFVNVSVLSAVAPIATTLKS
jgi:hypothetical protein